MNFESMCAEYLAEQEIYKGIGPSHVFDRLEETVRSEWPSATEKDFQWLAGALQDENQKWFAAFVVTRVEPLPECLYLPLIQAGVSEPDPSLDGRFIQPCAWNFGLRRVNTTLLDILETGTNLEKAGAAKAMYWARSARAFVAGRGWMQAITCGEKIREIHDDLSDLEERRCRLVLNEFVQNEDEYLRRNIFPSLPLRPGTYPPDAEDLVRKVIAIARNHPSEHIRKLVEEDLRS